MVATESVESERTRVEAWLLYVYIQELGFSERGADLLAAAGADHHAVKRALDGGCPRLTVLRIFT